MNEEDEIKLSLNHVQSILKISHEHFKISLIIDEKNIILMCNKRNLLELLNGMENN